MLQAKTRAELSEESKKFRPLLETILPKLQTDPEWYASVFFESKKKTTFSVDLKKSTLADDFSKGVVLRIYDGTTLFEEATDNLEKANLAQKAKELTQRVINSKNGKQKTKKRVYLPPPWSTRLKQRLESEILEQIPKNLKSDTRVHFGITYIQDPKQNDESAFLKSLKDLLVKVQTLAPLAELEPNDLTYINIRQLYSVEEFIFIDSEVNLSQTLLRHYRVLVTMSGTEKTMHLTGGLGGLECIEISDHEIIDTLKNLKGLKNFKRLKPGKHKVLFSPSLSGVLAHEAFGHSQEGDTCARGRSKAWNLFQSQEKVGNEYATILNNPALFQNGEHPYAAWGSYFFDEEGWLSEEQILLDKGRLTAPMTNLTSSIRLDVPRTANGKRENFSHGVYTRQTNTYFSAGSSTLKDLIEELNNGYIATHAAGGMEDPKGMGIQVGIAFLKEVKNGKLTGNILKGSNGGDIQMTGYTPDVLNSIIGKSKIEYESSEKDQSSHPFNEVGGCGKYHKEFVYAGCGGPYILMKDITLG